MLDDIINYFNKTCCDTRKDNHEFTIKKNIIISTNREQEIKKDLEHRMIFNTNRFKIYNRVPI